MTRKRILTLIAIIILAVFSGTIIDTASHAADDAHATRQMTSSG